MKYHRRFVIGLNLGQKHGVGGGSGQALYKDSLVISNELTTISLKAAEELQNKTPRDETTKEEKVGAASNIKRVNRERDIGKTEQKGINIVYKPM